MSRKWALIALKIAVSAGLIWFVISRIDFGHAVDRLTAVPVGALLLALACFAAQIVIGGARWREALVAIGSPLPLKSTAAYFHIGMFFNQTLPSGVGGDAMRIYKIYKDHIPLSPAFNSVMLERASMVIAVVLLIIGATPYMVTRIGLSASWFVPLVVVAAALVFGGLVIIMLLDRFPQRFHRWTVVRALAALAADARRIFLRPGPAIRILAWALFANVMHGTVIFVLANGMAANVSWVDCVILWPVVNLITTVPISIAGWGVREGAAVGVFSLIGMPAEVALALSLLFGVIGVVVALPGGLVWLMTGGRGESRLAEKTLEEAERTADEDRPDDAGSDGPRG